MKDEKKFGTDREVASRRWCVCEVRGKKEGTDRGQFFVLYCCVACGNEMIVSIVYRMRMIYCKDST